MKLQLSLVAVALLVALILACLSYADAMSTGDDKVDLTGEEAIRYDAAGRGPKPGVVPGKTKKGESKARRRLTITEVTASNLDLILRRNQVILLGVSGIKTIEKEIMTALGDFIAQVPAAEHGMAVARTSSLEVKKRFKVKKTPALLIITDDGDKVEEYSLEEYKAERLAQHISRQRSSYPVAEVGYMTSHHRSETMMKTNNLLHVMINATTDIDRKLQNYFMRRLDALADERGKNKSFRYAVGNIEHFQEMRVKYGNPVTLEISLPLVVLQAQGKPYKFEGDFSLPAIREWLGKWEKGELKHYRRSAGAVNNMPGTLFTLTTDNFGPVTSDWTKDVLVLFYGPECPYSKEFLEVEMPKLLDMVSHVSSLIVAKIDCSVNECSRGVVTGYPTIALYKGCRKNEKKAPAPLGYWQTREADDLFRWLKTNSYYSIPKKPVVQPSGERAADPMVAAAEQVGGELDPLANTVGLVL